MKRLLLLLILMVLAAPALASYRVTVSREGSNLYKIVGTDNYIKTRYCYVYGSWLNALVNEGAATIYFIDQDEECRIARIIR